MVSAFLSHGSSVNDVYQNYYTDDTRKTTLELAPNPEIRQMIEKAGGKTFAELFPGEKP